MDRLNQEKANKKRHVLYFRVSTQRQGNSGLGLDAQRLAVKNYIQANEVIAEFVEVETGTNKKVRIEIMKAIDLCKKEGATLIIAKLDRLSRSVAFIANLMESGIDFIAADMPEANRLTVHVMAAMAEYEARIISKRTKDSLFIAKSERNVKLGTPENLTQDARLKGAAKRRELAINNKNNIHSTSLILLLKKTAKLSYEKIAIMLNHDGFLTSTGKSHTGRSVQLLYIRAKSLELEKPSTF
jgi:DNA invertase Pin-like site-specific DNA recombinase